jgi:WD40 repeat protein
MEVETENNINTLKAHTSTVWTIDISKSGDFFFTGSDDRSIILWKIEDNSYKNIKMISKINGAHERSVLSLSLNFDDSLIVSGSSDNSITLWKVNYEENKRGYERSVTGISKIKNSSDAHDEDVNCVSWSNKNNIVTSGSDDGLVKIWLYQA